MSKKKFIVGFVLFFVFLSVIAMIVGGLRSHKNAQIKQPSDQVEKTDEPLADDYNRIKKEFQTFFSSQGNAANVETYNSIVGKLEYLLSQQLEKTTAIEAQKMLYFCYEKQGESEFMRDAFNKYLILLEPDDETIQREILNFANKRKV